MSAKTPKAPAPAPQPATPAPAKITLHVTVDDACVMLAALEDQTVLVDLIAKRTPMHVRHAHAQLARLIAEISDAIDEGKG